MCPDPNRALNRSNHRLFASSPHSSVKAMSGMHTINSPIHLEMDVQSLHTNSNIGYSNMPMQPSPNQFGHISLYNPEINYPIDQISAYQPYNVLSQTPNSIELEHLSRNMDMTNSRLATIGRGLTNRIIQNKSPNSNFSTMKSNGFNRMNNLERPIQTYLNKPSPINEYHRSFGFGLTLPSSNFGQHIVNSNSQQNGLNLDLKSFQNSPSNHQWTCSNPMATSFYYEKRPNLFKPKLDLLKKS